MPRQPQPCEPSTPWPPRRGRHPPRPCPPRRTPSAGSRCPPPAAASRSARSMSPAADALPCLSGPPFVPAPSPTARAISRNETSGWPSRRRARARGSVHLEDPVADRERLRRACSGADALSADAPGGGIGRRAVGLGEGGAGCAARRAVVHKAVNARGAALEQRVERTPQSPSLERGHHREDPHGEYAASARGNLDDHMGESVADAR